MRRVVLHAAYGCRLHPQLLRPERCLVGGLNVLLADLLKAQLRHRQDLKAPCFISCFPVVSGTSSQTGPSQWTAVQLSSERASGGQDPQHLVPRALLLR